MSLVSHDCDLVNGSYESEPFLEFFVAYPKPNGAENGTLFNGRNPRRLQFVAEENGETHLYEIDVNDKYRVGRRILETGVRDASVKISERDVRVIAKWAARRYKRPSLPTAFMDRVAGQVKKLRKKLEKDGEDITQVVLGFNTVEELPAERKYRIILRVVVPDDRLEDDTKEQRANSVKSEIQKLLAQCDGIELEDARLVGESDITLQDLRVLVPWDTDYLSPDEEQISE